MRYRFTGTSPRAIPSLGLTLSPGDEFECADKLNSDVLEAVHAVRKAPDKEPTSPPQET